MLYFTIVVYFHLCTRNPWLIFNLPLHSTVLQQDHISRYCCFQDPTFWHCSHTHSCSVSRSTWGKEWVLIVSYPLGVKKIWFVPFLNRIAESQLHSRPCCVILHWHRPDTCSNFVIINNLWRRKCITYSKWLIQAASQKPLQIMWYIQTLFSTTGDHCWR